VDVVHVVPVGAGQLLGSVSEVSKSLGFSVSMSLCLVDVLNVVVQVMAHYSGRALGVRGLGRISQSLLRSPSAHPLVLESLGLGLLAIGY